MGEANTAHMPTRGRPATGIRRHVIRDLMRAAEAALAGKTVREATIREIAAAAGTNEAMINYYFGSKEGLMVALFHEMYKNHPNTRAAQITSACISEGSIRPLVEELAKHYSSRPNIVRMAVTEMITERSKLKGIYCKKFAEITPNFIETVINSMRDAGVYSKVYDAKFATMSIMSMVVAPNFLVPATCALQMGGKLDSPEWIDHITRTIDLPARSPTH